MILETDDERFHAEAHHQPVEVEAVEWHELDGTLSKLKYALRNILLKEGSSFIHTIDSKNKTLTITCTFGSPENRKEISVELPGYQQEGITYYNVSEAIIKLKRQKEELSHD